MPVTNTQHLFIPSSKHTKDGKHHLHIHTAVIILDHTDTRHHSTRLTPPDLTSSTFTITLIFVLNSQHHTPTTIVCPIVCLSSATYTNHQQVNDVKYSYGKKKNGKFQVVDIFIHLFSV
uniref:Uncharacterized protein n=1 Tax=Cacopsylla melanoneura TaxID=428564 RepID=A0A8D8ZDP5_9HEMI